MMKQHFRQISPFLSVFLALALLGILAACNGQTSSTGNQTSTSTTIVGTKPPTVPKTTPTALPATPMPQTQTSCPAAGTARAMVTAPLAHGNHASIVYLATQFSNGSTTSILKRFNVVTGTTSTILTLTNEVVRDPQISADGQWILFDHSTITQDQLQMVRMDGRGLQTLYCGSTFSNIIWSTNQQSVLFSQEAAPQGSYGIYLLNLHTGTVQLELKPTQTQLGSNGVYPVTWLDNTRAYVAFTTAPIAPFDQLGILDTSKGPNQSASNLVAIYHDKTGIPYNYPCWNADSSYDASTLFVAQCSGISALNCSGSCELGTREGPSAIYTEPGAGGVLKTLLSSQTLGIAAVRSITSSLLLLQVDNFSQNYQIDTSQNGLWIVHSDGTGLTRLTTEANKTSTALCQFSQNPWSNASRDGTLYTFQTSASNSTHSITAYTLSYGSLSGGTPKSFASVNDGSQLAIIGWTTM